jgi:hypothetical protein
MPTNTQTIVGIEASALDVGDNGQIAVQAGTVAAPNTNVATGISVSGDSDTQALTAMQVGLLDSTVDIGNAGTLSVVEVSTAAATGTTVNGKAEALADYQGETGGILDTAATPLTDEIQIGAGGTVAVTVDNSASAASTAVEGISSASAQFTAGSFGVLDSDIDAGAGGTISVSIDANADAKANSIGPIAGDGDATALAQFTGPTAGIFATTAGAADIDIGDAGTISALAGVTADPLSLSATAFTVNGEAKAEALASTIAGIGSVAGTGDSNIDIGTVGNITAAAVVNSLSSATTTTNGATTTGEAAVANNLIEVLAGLGTDAGAVNVGTDATLTAVASSTSGATAVSVDGATKDTTADVGTDAVYGLNIDDLKVGNNASLTASAGSTQTASATTISAIGDASASALADVGVDDRIVGIDTTNIDIGKDSSKFSAAATLTGTATSSNINGDDSTSTAGDGSITSAIYGEGSTIQIGNNLTGTNGLRADAIGSLTATASNVEGTANASAGDKGGTASSIVVGIDDAPIEVGNIGNITSVGSATFTATATSIAGAATSNAGDENAGAADSRVTGISNGSVDIGQIGNITALATGTLNATATSTGGNAAATTAETGTGFLDGDITIGKEGNIVGQATLVGNATSTTIGPIGGTTTSDATLVLDANGIAQAATFTTEIGDTGNVTGSAFASGNSVSQITTGDAKSLSTITSNGIELAAADSDLTIGGTGSVTGLGVIGTLNSSGNLGSQVQVTSTSVGSDATSEGTFNLAGIFGDDAAEAQVTAGPRDGDITGQAIGGANLVSSTVGDVNAATPGVAGTADTKNTATLAGISDIDLIGGMVGQGSGTANSIRGTSFGDFDAAATSVNGDATSDSTVNAYGIFGGATGGTAPDDLSVNGNVTAIATLSNTVTATTVAGAATATATSNAIGISGYNINIIAGGSLTASATSNASTIANSIGGDV